MYFKNSLVVLVFVVGIVVVLGILGVYVLLKLCFKGCMMINVSFYMVYMFFGILLIVLLFKIILSLGLYDMEIVLIIMMVV